MIAISNYSAQDFLTALHGDSVHTFQTFDDDSDRKLPALRQVIHGTYEDAKQRLDQLNLKGAGVFVAVNMTDGKGRKTENITGITALFCDFDKGVTPDPAKLAQLPKPSIVVRSSETGLHYYWLLNPGTPIESFKPAQQALAAYLGSDVSVNDPTRVLRLPGTRNNKPDKAGETVAILEFSEARYSFDNVMSNVPAVAKATKAKTSPIAKECKAIREASEGTANDTMNRQAFLSGAKVSQGKIDKAEALEQLIQAGLDRGKAIEEVQDVVTRAIEDGILKASGTQDDDGLLLTKGLLNGNQVGKPRVAVERAKHLYPGIKFDVLVGRWTVDDGKSFLSATKMSQRLSGDFWQVQEWSGYPISIDSVHEGLKVAEMQEGYRYDSRKEYFEGLDWEGTEADAWLFLTEMFAKTAVQVASDFEALLMVKQMIGTVQRVYEPGCEVQTMLVLQSEKGSTGKSTLIKSICPRLTTDYVELKGKEVLESDEKRYIMKVEGKLIAVFNEVDQLTGSAEQRGQLKDYISSAIDEGVRMHGTERETMPRTYTLWGTVNDQKFLPAASEHAVRRRFYPVRTLATRDKMIDNPWVTQNRDLIWSAAKFLYQAGETYRLTADQERQQDIHVSQFCNQSEIGEVVMGWMADPNGLGFKVCHRYLLTDIAQQLYGKGFKRYQRTNLGAWLESEEGKGLKWKVTTSKGNKWYTCVADSNREIRDLIEGEDETPASPVEPETAKTEPQDDYVEDFGFDPIQPDRPF